jgi:hypothetical protein
MYVNRIVSRVRSWSLVGNEPSTSAKSGQQSSLPSLRGIHPASKKLIWAPLLSIASAVFAIETPFFFFGTPSGHDFEFHLYSWLEVLSQWKHGIIYPRWAALSHFAYGEPRFVFYPPASWTLGAALATIFPWPIVASVYIWLVLVGAGVSMFFLARQFLDRRDAIFAAVLYAINPYHLVIVYWRSAFAELLASVLLPLLILFLLRAADKNRRAIIFLAFVLAASWLVNAPSAVMIHYSLALLMVVVAWRRKSVHVLIAGTSAIILGAALASFYLLPAMYEQKWVNISQVIGVGLRPMDSFLFTHTTDPEHDAFNHLVSSMALAEILLTVAAAWAAKRLLGPGRELWSLLTTLAAICALLMLSVTNVLWDILPKLRFMQFPWRWLLCLGVPFSLLMVMGIKKWTLRVALYVVTLCVIAFGCFHFQKPWWDQSADLREMQDFMANGTGYEGTDEYTPVGADPSSVDQDKNARRVTVDGDAHAAFRVTEWSPEHKRFSAQMSDPDNLALHLFNYPAWQVEVNGKTVQAGAREGTGEMLIPAQSGANEVQIDFVRTWDRTAGGWISLAALTFTILLLVSDSGLRLERKLVSSSK